MNGDLEKLAALLTETPRTIDRIILGSVAWATFRANVKLGEPTGMPDRVSVYLDRYVPDDGAYAVYSDGSLGAISRIELEPALEILQRDMAWVLLEGLMWRRERLRWALAGTPVACECCDGKGHAYSPSCLADVTCPACNGTGLW